MSNRFKSPQILLTSKTLGINKIIDNATPQWTIDNVSIGTHQLVLNLFNKLPGDTIVDQSGQIIEDMFASITHFFIDGIDFAPNLNSLATYHDNEGNKIYTQGHLSFPKDYVINFQTPGVYLKRNLNTLNNHDHEAWFSSLV